MKAFSPKFNDIKNRLLSLHVVSFLRLFKNHSFRGGCGYAGEASVKPINLEPSDRNMGTRLLCYLSV